VCYLWVNFLEDEEEEKTISGHENIPGADDDEKIDENDENQDFLEDEPLSKLKTEEKLARQNERDFYLK